MALTKIEGGYFDPAAHAYYDEDGKWCPSVTQCLSLAGLSNYDYIKKDVLEAKALLGTDVHDLTATLDIHGFVDPSWVGERAAPYFSAYEKFRETTDFVPDPNWIERPIVAVIYGMKVGVTPDRFGKLNKHDCVVELKCVEQPLATWGYQTAIQEMAIYKSKQCGRARRIALQLTKSGKFKVDPHLDHSRDVQVALAALTLVYARLHDGQKVWEEI